MWRIDSLGKTWCWERLKAGKEKGRTEDEMVGWHDWLNGHEFEQAPGVGDGQGSLTCCSPWGHKESDVTEWLNWTEHFWFLPLWIHSICGQNLSSYGRTGAGQSCWPIVFGLGIVSGDPGSNSPKCYPQSSRTAWDLFPNGTPDCRHTELPIEPGPLASPALAGSFLTTSTTWEGMFKSRCQQIQFHGVYAIAVLCCFFFSLLMCIESRLDNSLINICIVNLYTMRRYIYNYII